MVQTSLYDSSIVHVSHLNHVKYRKQNNSYSSAVSEILIELVFLFSRIEYAAD